MPPAVSPQMAILAEPAEPQVVQWLQQLFCWAQVLSDASPLNWLMTAVTSSVEGLASLVSQMISVGPARAGARRASKGRIFMRTTIFAYYTEYSVIR